MLATVALVAGMAGTAAATPTADPTEPGARCIGRTPATQQLLDDDGLPFPTGVTGDDGTGLAALGLDVDVTVTAPEAVAVGTVDVPVTVEVAVALPRAITDPLHDLGVRSIAVDDQVATIEITAADPGSLEGPPADHLVELPAPEPPAPLDAPDETSDADDEPPLATFVTTVAGAVDAVGPDRSAMAYRLGEVAFDLRLPPVPGTAPDGLVLELTCGPTGPDPVASTHILDPGPPVAPDVRTEVDFGGSTTVALLVGGNPTVDDVVVVAQGVRGSATIARVEGRWELTYEHDPRGGDGPDRVEYQAVNAHEGNGIGSGTVFVEVLPDPCEVEGACPDEDAIGLDGRAGDNEGLVVLDEVEVHDAGTGDDLLRMEQATAGIALTATTLDGSPGSATGVLGSVTVVDARTDGPGWDLVGSVSAFTTDPEVTPCTLADPTTWDRRCIPANNLGWSPGIAVLHAADADTEALVRPGEASDPLAIADGSPGSGLEVDQVLCAMEPGGDAVVVRCGAGLGLLIPGSIGTGSYRATLTLTLV